jgi:hypothetical protein
VPAQRPNLSQQFLASAQDEVNRLRDAAAQLRTRAQEFLEQGERLLAEAMSVDLRVRDLDELLGLAPQMSLYDEAAAIRGRQLRDVAVDLLLRQHGVRRPIHYRGWFDLLEAEGHRVSGRDPVATFLTEITREPTVRRVKGAPRGTYELDPETALEEATRRVREAAMALQDEEPSAPDAASNRRRRNDLQREKRVLDRILRVRARLHEMPSDLLNRIEQA